MSRIFCKFNAKFCVLSMTPFLNIGFSNYQHFKICDFAVK